MSKTVDDPPCIAPSSTVTASQQEVSFLVSTNLFAPYRVTKVCDDFGNRVLLSTKNNGKSLYCFGGLWDTHDQLEKYPSHTWHWTLYLAA